MATGTHYWCEVTIMLDETQRYTPGGDRSEWSWLFSLGGLVRCVVLCVCLVGLVGGFVSLILSYMI